MTHDSTEPISAAEFPIRLRVFRIICLGLISGLLIVTASIAGVVHFALDGIPLAGNAQQFAGRPLVSWLALGLTIVVPGVALLIGQTQVQAGLKKLRNHPEFPLGPGADVEPLAAVYGGGRFIEVAMAEAVGFGCALLYHFTADPLMFLLIAVIVMFMLSRLPSPAGFQAWVAGVRQETGEAV